MKYLWMAVTPDKYELPLVVADSAKELGYKLGVSGNAIRISASRGLSGKKLGRKIIKVNMD